MMVMPGKGWELGQGSPAGQPLTCRAGGCSRLDSGFCLDPWNVGLFVCHVHPKKINVKGFGESGWVCLLYFWQG